MAADRAVAHLRIARRRRPLTHRKFPASLESAHNDEDYN